MRLTNRSTFAALAILLIVAAPLAGCFAEETMQMVEEEESRWLPSVFDRSNMVYIDDDIYSRVSVNGSFDIDTVRSVYVEVPEITLADGGAALTLSLIHI